MKGIILAAGKGTRLYPATVPVCKPLLPVYDKPLISYSLATLISCGIREVLMIVPPDDTEPFARLYGDGAAIGLRISYLEQKVQCGIADAFRIGKGFIGDDSVCLILGDNIFYHPSLPDFLKTAAGIKSGAAIFGYYVEDPRPFGVVEFDTEGNAVSIEEKPQNPKSNYIVPGLYFYENSVVDIAEHLQPSARGELEITDVNLEYLRRGTLRVYPLPEHTRWLDAGNCDTLLLSANTVREILSESGVNPGCPEEAALREGFITAADVARIGAAHSQTAYGQYLLRLAGTNF